MRSVGSRFFFFDFWLGVLLGSMACFTTWLFLRLQRFERSLRDLVERLRSADPEGGLR